MIGQIGGLQCAQNISCLSRLSGSSMSDHQKLARLNGRLVSHDAVFGYAYAIQTGADGAQAAHHDRIFQGRYD